VLTPRREISAVRRFSLKPFLKLVAAELRARMYQRCIGVDVEFDSASPNILPSARKARVALSAIYAVLLHRASKLVYTMTPGMQCSSIWAKFAVPGLLHDAGFAGEDPEGVMGDKDLEALLLSAAFSPPATYAGIHYYPWVCAGSQVLHYHPCMVQREHFWCFKDTTTAKRAVAAFVISKCEVQNREHNMAVHQRSLNARLWGSSAALSPQISSQLSRSSSQAQLDDDTRSSHSTPASGPMVRVPTGVAAAPGSRAGAASGSGDVSGAGVGASRPQAKSASRPPPKASAPLAVTPERRSHSAGGLMPLSPRLAQASRGLGSIFGLPLPRAAAASARDVAAVASAGVAARELLFAPPRPRSPIPVAPLPSDAPLPVDVTALVREGVTAFESSTTPFCRYCKKYGHAMEVCPKRPDIRGSSWSSGAAAASGDAAGRSSWSSGAAAADVDAAGRSWGSAERSQWNWQQHSSGGARDVSYDSGVSSRSSHASWSSMHPDPHGRAPRSRSPTAHRSSHSSAWSSR
jgi:hypothetical protein